MSLLDTIKQEQLGQTPDTNNVVPKSTSSDSTLLAQIKSEMAQQRPATNNVAPTPQTPQAPQSVAEPSIGTKMLGTVLQAANPIGAGFNAIENVKRFVGGEPVSNIVNKPSDFNTNLASELINKPEAILPATVHGVANAASFGQANKLAALAASKFNGKSYDENLADINTRTESLKAAAPTTFSEANFGGSFIGAPKLVANLVGKGLERLATRQIAKAIGTKNSEVANFVKTQFGPTSSIESLATKNNQLLVKTENELQKHLLKFEDKAIPVNYVDPTAVKDLSWQYAKAQLDPEAAQLWRIGNKLEQTGTLTPSEAFTLKRFAQTESKFTKGGEPGASKIAQGWNVIRNRLGKDVESVTDDKTVRTAMQTFQKAHALKQTITKKLNNVEPLLNVKDFLGASALSYLTSNPALGSAAVIGSKFAKTVPGATISAPLLQILGKGAIPTGYAIKNTQ